jgi:hypothetical protein
MTIVQTFNFTKELFDLKIFYQNIYSTTDILSFQLDVSKSIKLLSNLSKIIRNKRNVFSNYIPSDLLKNIFSFLPNRFSFSSLSICKNWYRILSHFLKIVFFSKLPTDYYMKDYILTNEYVNRITNNGKHIFVCGNNNKKCYDNNLNLISTIDGYCRLISVNDKYLLHSDHSFSDYTTYFELYSLSEQRTIKKWHDNRRYISDFSIYGKYICIVDRKKFYIYDFDGQLLKEWKLNVNKNFMKSNLYIAISNDEIFLSVSDRDYVQVFSLDGKPLRKLKIENDSPDEKYFTGSITICNNIICISAYRSNKIFVFECSGAFLFRINCHLKINYVTLMSKRLYVTCYYDKTIIIYDLLYNEDKKLVKKISNKRK